GNGRALINDDPSRAFRPAAAGGFAVRARRVQFTIRTLMIAVVVVACGLAFLKQWPEGLAVLVLLALPLYGLSRLLGKIPERFSAWRLGMCVAMLSVIMLGVGWSSARGLMSMAEWQGGHTAIYRAWVSGGAWPLHVAIPAGLTAIGLLLN